MFWALRGVGLAADGVDEFDNADPRAVYGGGFRYLAAKDYGIHVGLDLAQGPEDKVVYL